MKPRTLELMARYGGLPEDQRRQHRQMWQEKLAEAQRHLSAISKAEKAIKGGKLPQHTGLTKP